MKRPTHKILVGDVLKKLREQPDRSVHCVITSPPYLGLRDYGLPPTRWPEVRFVPVAGLPEMVIPSMSCCHGLESDPWSYIGHEILIWREVRRVLRDDGTAWVNMGDSYAGGGRGGNPEDSPFRKQATNAGSLVAPSPVPHGLKPKDLCGIPWRLAFALQADGWYLRSDIIWSKCISGGATVYARTAKGEMPMTVKDMVRLDPATVMLWDGEKWNQCVSWGDVPGDPERKQKSTRSRSDRYRGKTPPVAGDIELEFRSGERIGCTRGHKWPTQRGIVEASEIVVGDIVSRVQLPEPLAPLFPSALADEDSGWFIGMYLAEGSQSDGTLQFAGHQKETQRNARIKRIAESLHGYCAVHNTSDNGCTANVNGPMLRALVETYSAGRTAKDKHLHPRCWSRSNVFLQALLCGYLEGDGYRRKNGSWKLGFANNDALVTDLRTIGARIGASVRLRRAVATNAVTGKKHQCWSGDIVFDPSLRRQPDGEVVAIRQSRARMFHNVSLADDPHIFALASGLCTKNSNPMPESVTDRPTKAHEYLFLLTKSPRYFYDAEAIREEAQNRPFDPAKKIERDPTGMIMGNAHNYAPGASGYGNAPGGRNRRTVWTIATQAFPGAHFATFPEALVEPCIKAGTSERGVCPSCGAPWARETKVDYENPGNRTTNGPRSTKNRDITAGFAQRLERHTTTIGFRPSCTCGGDPVPAIVMDIFGGSGTTSQVARSLHRSSIYIDRSQKYAQLAREKIKKPTRSEKAKSKRKKCSG